MYAPSKPAFSAQRTFSSRGFNISCLIGLALTAATVHGGEPLYNGIVLPEAWPPKQESLSREPLAAPPYLTSPPEVIPIDVGRQLFVDDFLIESTTLERRFHRPDYHPANPLLVPDKPWEGTGGRARAACFSDGVWFDPHDKLFKLWYWASASSLSPLRYDTCLATSRDGIHWEKPEFDVVPGTNIVLRDEDGVNRNSSTVWLDHAETDPERRFKMFRVVKRSNFNRVRLSTSPDGIHWTYIGETDDVGDRTTVFFNPFRNVWVYSLRTGTLDLGRCRGYAESAAPLPRGRWVTHANYGRGKTFWVGADTLDPDRGDLTLRREASRQADLVPSQLYNLDCVAYESVLLGMFSIWRGQPVDRPKINELCAGFSRDGFHWSRPDRRAFCPVSEERTAWNWGNVQSAGGCCLVVGDKLHFYVGGVSGAHSTWHPDPSRVGLAVLRRDGFASLDAGKSSPASPEPGILTTRPVQFSGKQLFVNVAAPDGELRVEVLDKSGQVIEPFTRDACVPLRTDETKAQVKWRTTDDLSPLAGRPVRFRFHLTRGSLYSFWVSADAAGASHGFVAAGGPGFANGKDALPTRR
jgi:hypothetical protein